MEECRPMPSPASRPPAGRAGLALALSLAAHGLVVFSLALGAWGAEGQPGPRVSVDAVAFEEGRLTLDDPAPRGGLAKAQTRLAGTEESEAFLATVADAAPVPSPGVTGAAPVVVVGHPQGGRPGAGTAAGRGSRGLLRPPAEARRVVFVVDRSISMGPGGAFEAARAEVVAALEALPAEAHFQVVLYNHRAEPLPFRGNVGLVPATEENRREAARLLEEVRCAGATDHAAGLRRALVLEPDTIYLVTDADEMTHPQVVALTRLNRGRAALHAVELRDGPAARDDAPLPTLARLNRGTHRTAPTSRP